MFHPVGPLSCYIPYAGQTSRASDVQDHLRTSQGAFPSWFWLAGGWNERIREQTQH